MAVVIVDRDFGYNELIESLEDLEQSDGIAVLVGFLAADAGDDLLVYAAANEFGTEDIPERSFLRSTVDKNRAKYEASLARVAGHLADGKGARGRAERELQKLGLTAVGDVQQQIVDIKDPPNAASTIAAKGSSNPLIDTGRMRQSVSFVVVEGSEVIG